MLAPLLETAGLTKDYGAHRALADLSLTVAPGEIVGLLGPNGSGKTTALRVILGMLRPTSGTASVAGFDSWKQSVEVRRRVAYLPGELRLYERMTGRQLVRFLESLRGGTFTTDPDSLARRLDIDLDRPLIHLSSGMKRKVALMTVLLPRVELLILDEPTNALDPTMRDSLLQQLLEAKHRGQAVLFSSHVLTEVEQICDRIAILKNGRLVHLQRASDTQTARRVVARFAAPPDGWPEGTAPTVMVDGSYRFDFRGPLPALLDWLTRYDVTDLRVEPIGLGAVYSMFHGNDE
jgi:ABC-2 type transport system ATP-binding protein